MNSFLQIGVAFGGLILAVVLALLILGLLNSYELFQKRHEIMGSLCLLWTTTWIICSCFSTMMRRSMLVAPVVISILLALLSSKPKFKHISMSLGIAVACSVGMYIAGFILTANSQFKIDKTNGVVHISNAGGISGKNCVFYADESVLGKKYGKEVRRLIDKQRISNCYVIDDARSALSNKPITDAKTVCVLSGYAISTIDVDKIQSKIILLYPQCNVKQPVKSTNVKQIIFPEIDPLKTGIYGKPSRSGLQKFD